MSPRRSSRARGTQPLPSAPAHTASSNSSVSSGRQERNTRSGQRQPSPRRSDPRSQSGDDVDEPKPPPRRTRSGHEEIKEPTKSDKEEDNDEDADEEADDAIEEEEVTRCVCGQSDYPGLPLPIQEQLKQNARHPDAKYELDSINDDLGGLFVQCDICKVWQHGGCVGILDETAANRDDYFCEQCRKDLHKISIAPNGIPYSTYLPSKEEVSPAETPEPSSRDRTRRNADSKNRDTLDPPKRRSTMVSREIYDEAEEFRRAIEESKKDAIPADGSRRKRGRDDHEEAKPIVKRQRTGSRSGSPDGERAASSSSDEALATKATIEHTPKKMIRGAAARNHAAKEAREQKERERLKAAETRKSRMERRRGDDSDNADELQSTQQSAVSSPQPPEPSTSRSTTRKGAKPASRPAKRVGRNQYTKDRDISMSVPSNSLDPHAGDTRNTRARSRSRSVVRDTDSPNGGIHSINGTPGDGSGSRFLKVKHVNPNRTTMNEMKKRIAAIMEYVNRAEDEISRQNSLNIGGTSSISGASTDSISTAVPDEYKTVAVTGAELDFGALTSKEMITVLKARLVAWEDEYGRYPR